MMKKVLLGTLFATSSAAVVRGPSNAQCMGSPCSPSNQACGKAFENAPAFHLMDQRGCGENDPNGPVFDPVHGVIHHFFQDHLAADPGVGAIYGHFVSKDFVHWAQLPVAIWNGLDTSVSPPRVTKYDNQAIYTGSAFVVDGAGPGGKGPGVVNLYPGLCNKKDWPGCDTGTVFAQAVPADYANDELLTNWTKPSYNPVMENTQRDPSSPWKTASGEWRFRSYDSKVYGAASDADVVAGKWYLIGQNPDFRTCECPSFYPLPAATPGFEAAYQQAAVQGALPTHVHKTSCGGDWWQLGTYEEGAPKTLGHFHSTPGWEDVFVQKRIDTDSFYASKDNEYPAKNGEKRRINWGWAMVPPGSAQSLPRVITFNAAARCLEQAPIEELESLRGPAAFSQTGVKLAAGLPMYLNLALGLAKQSEFVATIELPMEPASIRVSIGVSNCTIDYAPSANSAAAFYEVPVTCASNTQNFTQSLRLLASEKTLEIRIFIDWTFMEAFFQKGRATLTFHGALDDLTGISVASSAAATVQSMSVYPMKSIWTSPEEVRKMPRVYPSPHQGSTIEVFA
ncbi:unnamed protein product [Polarella glacialis]|uniref:Beta-fructofuranosidase n=2 Tax=Polarella glacialis TaxID=89957 RepID=A0A813FW65_POLGL|nr:unnamed protein product [Polarella glacialis]|eukprot:CAMPEP_0115062058 /NCGR_PEP_ID=MMETSP0227-20121206/8339_1 /TAXON_ID=89957 /ORGANISM="Polarella glacialis, Strain CCMP 1383" /LENGTH=565 /DNA_ID=CAMNT_0002447403 /DNA_START=56 /DNA_END=1753 /DNA_ORIENTATION=+